LLLGRLSLRFFRQETGLRWSSQDSASPRSGARPDRRARCVPGRAGSRRLLTSQIRARGRAEERQTEPPDSTRPTSARPRTGRVTAHARTRRTMGMAQKKLYTARGRGRGCCTPRQPLCARRRIARAHAKGSDRQGPAQLNQSSVEKKARTAARSAHVIERDVPLKRSQLSGLVAEYLLTVTVRCTPADRRLGLTPRRPEVGNRTHVHVPALSLSTLMRHGLAPRGYNRSGVRAC